MREEAGAAGSPRAGQESEADASALLALTRRLLADLHPGAAARGVALDSRLDKDLGFDSLARVELVARIERDLGVALPEKTLGSAVTLRDLLLAMRAQGVPAAARTSGGRTRAAVSLETTAAQLASAEILALPDSATTLLDVLAWHVARHGERVQIVHLDESGETPITYAELDRQARAIAAGLQDAGLAPRQTVAIMLPTQPEYFHVYFGILMAGGIPVPIYPPASLAQLEEHVRRHAGILANAGASILVTVPEARAVARLLEARVPGLRRIVTPAELAACAIPAQPVAVAGSDTAFIQYTSGSTGDPKGVVLSHANLLANVRAMGQAIGIRGDDVFVSWLPLYHDMGLICAWLASLHHGRPLVVMSPLRFLARPLRWLEAIDRYRGTLAAAPNFAYELCVKRIDDADLAGLDLSCWRIAANGAEPVLPETLRRFGERFASCGFRTEALTPVYGLAEGTVGLLCPPPGRGPRVDRVERAAFSRGGRAEPATEGDVGALRFVSCGRPLPGHEVRIVDASGKEVGERVEGRLEFRGPSATAGYYRNPEQTRRLFDGDWLDSGDRAYVADGEVYLTGRVKDIIIRGGRNIYPHELEDAVGGIEGVRRGCVVVFGASDGTSGTERLVVLAESRLVDGAGGGTEQEAEREALRQRIVDLTVAVLGEPPDEVVLAPPHAVLKTSSGKVRRAACRERYLAGTIGASARSGSAQLVRLTLASLWPQARRAAGALAAAFWGIAVWLPFLLLAVFAWLATAAAPRRAAAWKMDRLAARALLKLAGIRLTIEGLERLPQEPCVVVANHASYADGIVLLAALPAPVGFVAKRELLGNLVSRLFLEKLGALFVERFDTLKSIDDAHRLGAAVAAGETLFFFPEGTFRRTPGLGAFRLGAFSVAATAGVPVLPLTLRGTRRLLPAGRWLPRHTQLGVVVGTPIAVPTEGDSFAAAVVLRDGARAQILRDCGEPDLGAT